MRKFTQEERERERNQARLKWERDQTAFIDEAREEAREKALEEGREEGREEGELIGRINLCQRLLKMPLTPKNEFDALPIEELRLRADVLEKQLGVAHQ